MPVAGAWVIADGPAILLGRMQHAGRVLADVAPPGWAVLRRATTGPAVALDGGLLVSVALSSIDQVFRDTTHRTVLNRNLRLFLLGLRHAGLPAVYWGREWLAWQRRPIATCGLEMTPSGALLIEAFFTNRGSLAVPRDLLTDVERSIDRYGGKQPASLEDAASGGELVALGDKVLDGIVERVGLDPLEHQATAAALDMEVASPDSPMASPIVAHPPIAVPIGWLDVARTAAGMWVGGDVLAPSYTIGVGRPPPGGAPMEGATWADVSRAQDAAP